jgi:hypothetical protein
MTLKVLRPFQVLQECRAMILRTVELFKTRDRTKYSWRYRELIKVTKLVILQLRSHFCGSRFRIELDSDRFIFGPGLGGI